MRKTKSATKSGAEVNLQKIKAALKHVLKQKDLNYKDVAGVWGCSEPTVKRLFGPEEIPLSRLLSLLEFLGLSLKELEAITQLDSLAQPLWTVKQNDFLAKNPRVFAFLMKMYETDSTPQTIAKTYKIESKELDRILIQLEKHNLIRVTGRGIVKPFPAQVPQLEGRLGAVHTERILDRMNRYLKSHIYENLARKMRGLPGDNNKGKLFFAVTEITPKTYSEYRAKFERLHEDMMSAATVEQSSLPKSQLKKVVTLIAAMLNEADSPELQAIENIFGDELAHTANERAL